MSKLPKPRFNLKAPKSDADTLILMFFRYRGKKLQYSTSLHVHPTDWDTKANRSVEQEERNNLRELNKSLDDLSSHCLDIYIEYNYGEISIPDFKTELDKRIFETSDKTFPTYQKEPSTKSIHLFDFMDAQLQEFQEANMKNSSLKTYRTHAKVLKEFGNHFNKYNAYSYEDVDWNFRLKLIDWLASRNAQLAYGNKTLKVLRQLLELARRKKLHSNTQYQGKGWTVTRKKAKSQTVIFSMDELHRLANIKITGHLDKVRDICLIGAGTGQRHSDFCKYQPEQFSISPLGIPILSVISDKTDTPAKIPLNMFPWLLPVLEKHKYTTPKMSMQKFNDGLKELAELVEFNDRVLIVNQYIGRQARVEKYYAQKHTVVSSHLCRRSFATNLYRMGFKLSQIMLMTGHATESQLRQYIGIDGEQNAEEIGLIFMQQQQPLTTGNSRLKMV